MNHLRQSVTTLIILIALFFNIERVDVYGNDSVNILSFTYILVIVAIFSILATPFFRWVTINLWVMLWSIVYFAFRLTFFAERPLVGGIYTYLSITELVFLLLCVLLAHNIARYLYDFEDAVENITFAGIGKRVLVEEENVENIKIEVNRGRRYNRPFSVLVFEPLQESLQASLNYSVHQVQQTMMGHYIFLGMTRVLSQMIRRIDMMIMQKDNQRLVLLCPETHEDGAKLLAERIVNDTHKKMHLHVKYGVASFPENAFTYEELLNKAVDDMHRNHPCVECKDTNQVDEEESENTVDTPYQAA